jgi:hypothetical protein
MSYKGYRRGVESKPESRNPKEGRNPKSRINNEGAKEQRQKPRLASLRTLCLGGFVVNRAITVCFGFRFSGLFRSSVFGFWISPAHWQRGRRAGVKPTGASTTGRRSPKYFLILYLHFLKTVLELSTLGIFFGSGWLFFERVPLGRFYSSRPSSRSHRQNVSE